ncbi:MAG: UDP-3-O-(3-hydroxymyristoyl)glucosamine N-acyltransferase [Lentimicrobiaceae bacterium]|jgi:UDP-3-O-[3-hydroxymyristoyl] glucosamine N-acyltransferase|nr:UDP-3-O-(3-hydroxymyristoyl)glucosamine N-acyltransferase [Lentimicrobiaceae bacterium]MBT3453409.1 UDP-3-O-(3-hydroxymyristoyl)glucosamine N-acyltransferase [Lentimicrobiaceae bacterium]MBT3819408.1 UDP-3-O-(3-hydroxymyristoyl)glucosamine N-acyltransferase [Lentimicrobiaceae bacterium]MBT4061991.1 UDP-3-O-(3-hydroxymyristoyl)glucosamine N-acyltransferase [Lentimicrobiaceae bacterium]MBT4191576.1 UDP-3-O-(3-hydroxymyristoyl)glucosamine N-acyltransferase [Lentimicrobiaceae bacterium]
MDFQNSITLGEIAKLIDGKVIGDSNAIVIGLNEIHVVRNGDITFVDHPKYYKKVLESDASFVIINKEVDAPDGKSLIIHDAPMDAFNKLINHSNPFLSSEKMISDSAQVGDGTVIQPGVFIGNNVKIGGNCIIHANVSIYDGCEIGDNVIIHSNSVLGGDAYYFQKRNEDYVKFLSAGKVVIESDVEIGASCSIDKGVTGNTIIGRGTKLDNQCQVGHDTVIGKHCLIGAFAAIAGVTTIEDEVVIWARVAINKDIVIGKKAVILATSAVDKSIEGGKVYMGSPVMEVRQYWRYLASLKKIPDLIRKLNV